MLTYIIKRLLLMIPTLLGIMMIVFLIVRLAPGNPIALDIRGEGGNVETKYVEDEDLIKLRERMYGLDKPIPIQYVQWLWGIIKLDLGESITEHRPVTKMIGERIGITIRLNILAFLVEYLIAIPLGLIAARNRYAGPLRRAVFDTTNGFVLLVLYSLPSIFIGTALITCFARGGIVAEWIQTNHPAWSWLIFPIGGIHTDHAASMTFFPYVGDFMWHMVLPVITLAIGGLAFMAKLGRTSLLENLSMDYVRTAYAKGLRDRSVVYVHALRNSLLPMITILVGILPALIGGSVIVETIFNLNGMGQLFWTAVTRRDYEMIQALSLVGATLTLVAILLADILYALVDPRVRYD